MPSLPNLRKRAKTLVRQHRDGYYPIAARLRATVPRFADVTDRAILDAAFTLADAQGVVAREAGFADWAHATKELESMSHPENATSGVTPRLRVAYPQLFVADVRRATAYYESLGFATAYVYGEPPFYALVTRDDVGLNLRFVHAPVVDRREDAVLSANIVVDNVKALFLELLDRGVDFVQRLQEQPWGASDFIARDPDGNLLCFASPPR
jgi:catechol 2,3-dioxygenase-like lactoylglutathione lyase family enzyme